MASFKSSDYRPTAEWETLALPKGALILVTGAAGFIASQVVNEALKAGYSVRGTSRSEERADYLKKVFKHHPNLSTAVVSDMQTNGVWDDVVKDCSAIIHMATDVSFDPDPNKVVTETEAGMLNILQAASKVPSMKRFVLTSSSSAALLPHPNVEVTVGVDDYCQEAVDLAWAPPPYEPERAFAVYAASKVAGEKALWKYVQDQKPKFVVNTILPNFNIGTILTAGGPTGSSIETLLNGSVPPFPPQYHIDVIDCARIHVIAAALDTSIGNERIFAFNVPFTFTEMIEIIKALRPSATKVASPPENEGQDLSKVPNALGAELLRKWYGQDGYKSLRQSIAESMASQL